MIETELRRYYVARMTAENRRLRLFIRNVGRFALSTGGYFRSGIEGQSDIYGFYLKSNDAHSVPVEIELKNVRTPHTDAQKSWEKFCASWGIPHLLLRAGANETDEEVLDRWVEKTGAWLGSL